MTNQLPPDYTISGADLIAKGTDSFGFKFPDDWQIYEEDLGRWKPAQEAKFFGWNKYRINPDRLKPPKPEVGSFCVRERGWLNAIELTPEVRRRLGKDAGVTKHPNRYRFGKQSLQEAYMVGWIEHQEAVAAGKVDIDE